MSDFLTYRLPGEHQVHTHVGTFRKVLEHEKPAGFVISDFLHQHIYLFESSQDTPEKITQHFSKTQPIVISRRDYQLESQAFLNAFPLFSIEKGVYSRVKQVSFNSDKSRDLFERLCDEYPNAFCYLLSSEKVGTWIGASPELLLQQQGMICRTVALASTHPSDESSTWNEKELNEHRYVVEAIEDTLEKQACIDIERDGPKEHFAGPVVHLRTDFQATLTKANAWEIVNDLHPTPAVCGTPRNLALQLIETREMHKRELYSGYIGWFEEGNTKLFVNLRCAQLFKEQAYLYVGGGYTIDSIPDLEWDETERKAETLLHLMRSFD